MNPIILVTGATGNTGLPLVEQLANTGQPFRAMVHSAKNEGLAKKGKAATVAADFGDIPSLERALEGIDRAYLVSPASPDMANYQKNFVDAAKKTGLKHIVKLAGLGTALDSPVGLLRRHADIEEYIKKSGIAYTFLRAHFFMENLLGSAATVKNEGAIYSPLGEARVSPISVQDIAAVALKALTEDGHAGKTYTLTGPESVTYGRIAEIFGGVIGRKITYIPVSYEMALDGMIKSGMPEWFAEDLVRLLKSWSDGKGNILSTDVEKITGRKPISLKEFFFKHKSLFIGTAEKAA
jgi:uncharacterized protein YbjT (DUF2867 family)